MIEQLLVSDYKRKPFVDRVNDLLKKGWTVVPGTMIISDVSTDATSNTTGSFAIVLQRARQLESGAACASCGYHGDNCHCAYTCHECGDLLDWCTCAAGKYREELKQRVKNYPNL